MSHPRPLLSLLGRLLLGASLLCAGCTRPAAPPSAPASGGRPVNARMTPLAPADKEAVDRLLATWKHTVEWVGVPPLSSLEWRRLQKGDALPADTLVLTDKRSTVTLGMPKDQFKPAFVELVRGGRVVGFQMAGDVVEVEIQPDTLYPVRPAPDANVANASLHASVVRLEGTAIYTVDREAVARNYSPLTAHNPPYPPKNSEVMPEPSLAPQPVHVKKGLGIRGKDLSSLSPDAIRKMYLDSQDGVYIDAVFPGSPADRAGIQAHDVVRRFNGLPIRNSQELMRAMEAAPADKAVTIEVVRTIIDLSKTQSFTYSITLGGFSGDAHLLPTPNPTTMPDDAPSASAAPSSGFPAAGSASPASSASGAPASSGSGAPAR